MTGVIHKSDGWTNTNRHGHYSTWPNPKRGSQAHSAVFTIAHVVVGASPSFSSSASSSSASAPRGPPAAATPRPLAAVPLLPRAPLWLLRRQGPVAQLVLAVRLRLRGIGLVRVGAYHRQIFIGGRSVNMSVYNYKIHISITFLRLFAAVCLTGRIHRPRRDQATENR